MATDYLTEQQWLATGIPAKWAPLIDDLAQLYDLAVDKAPPTPERRARAQEIRDRIQAGAVDLIEVLAPDLANDSPRHIHWFVQAALLWMHFVEVVVADEILDTIRSENLRRFPVDLPADDEARQTLRRGLRHAFHLSESELATMERELEALSSNLRLKRRITAELRRRLMVQGSPPPAERLALMQRLYGPLPLLPQEVDLVITATSILFCISFLGEELVGPGWEARSEEEKDQVRTFLRALKKGNTAKTDRFPAFGAFDRARLDRNLATELTAVIASETGFGALHPEVVHETLATMVSILPRPLVEQYLIHDTWGHGWQEALCDFEWYYQRLVHVSDPLTPDSGPYFGGEGSPRLREAFVVQDGSTRLDEDVLLRFAEMDLAGRMMAGINGIMAELLADLVEGKFARQTDVGPDRFPTSSLLPGEVIKLDLTIQDTRMHIRWWRRPYLQLQEKAEERQRLLEELAAAGCPRPGLAEAIEQAAGSMVRHLEPAFGDRLAPPRLDPAGAYCYAGFFERFLLNIVSLEHELRAFVREADGYVGENRWLRPETCTDFLVVLLAWFYERDRARFVWNLDELLHHALRPSFARLRQALAES